MSQKASLSTPQFWVTAPKRRPRKQGRWAAEKPARSPQQKGTRPAINLTSLVDLGDGSIAPHPW